MAGDRLLEPALCIHGTLVPPMTKATRHWVQVMMTGCVTSQNSTSTAKMLRMAVLAVRYGVGLFADGSLTRRRRRYGRVITEMSDNEGWMFGPAQLRPNMSMYKCSIPAFVIT